MKSKIIKRIVGICSIGLAAVIGFRAISDAVLSVDAAETLFGIETLIQDVQRRETPYRILEVVPDVAAAEIGYYIPGYEPALSERNEDGTWKGWLERLSEFNTFAERQAFIFDLELELEQFYNARGYDVLVDDLPVEYESYEEVETPTAGYTAIEFATTSIIGYFSKYTGGAAGTTRYAVNFEYAGNFGSPDLDAKKQHYYVTDATQLSYDTLTALQNSGRLSDGTILYTYEDGTTGFEHFVQADTWGALKAGILAQAPAVSGNDTSGNDASGNNAGGGTAAAPIEYYILTMERVQENTAQPAYPALYTIKSHAVVPDGEYEFIPDVNGFEYKFSSQTAYFKGGFINNEYFRINVLNMEEDELLLPDGEESFPIEVITLTVEELNKLSEEGGMPEFDMLYLNSGKQEYKFDLIPPTYTVYSLDNDISDDVMEYLFVETMEDGKPCIVDASIVYEVDGRTYTDLYDSNIFRLGAMFMQASPTEYWENYFVGVEEEPELDELLGGIVEDADRCFVTEQTYSFLGKSFIEPRFNENDIYDSATDAAVSEGFQDVLDEIDFENQNREADATGTGQYTPLPTDISKATVIRHIMNYQNRREIEVKGELRVLEIQPCKVTTPDLTEEEVKRWAGAEADSEDVQVTIETITTAEFIGRIEDLNEEYDLIYIGADTDHLNMLDGQTVFNDAAMNGLIYFHTGDQRIVAMELGGQLLTEYVGNDPDNNLYYYNTVRYGGNDITQEKVDALNAFLNASYPIVVSDKCFESAVTLYNDADWKLEYISLAPGEYTNADLQQMGYNLGDVPWTSSLTVADGYQVTLYTGDNFTGESRVYTRDSNYVGVLDEGGIDNKWNDAFLSAKVEKIEKTEQQKTVDEDHVDNSSYMYDFLQGAKDNDNFYTRSEIIGDEGKFSFYLNRPKVEFAGGVDVTCMDDTDINNEELYLVSQEADGRFLLEYAFTIENQGAATADTRYNCHFYIDVNADGRYSDSEELGDIIITQDDETVDADELYAGREYVLRRYVPADYIGVLPWKIQIQQDNNPYIHNGEVGYTKLVSAAKETIDIIQICRDKTGPNEADNRLLNLEAAIGDENGDWDDDPDETNIYNRLVYGDGEEYAGIIDDFDIDVDYYLISEFEDAFDLNNDLLDEYDMMILGFSDMYGEISGDEDDGPMGAILDFIDSGKSVLFAHDSISYFNYEKNNPDGDEKEAVYNRDNPDETEDSGQNHNSYSLTKYARDLVGMDRYGISKSDMLKQGNYLVSTDGDWDELPDNKEVAYVPKSGKKAAFAETQGYTYTVINGRDNKVGENRGNHATYYTYETGLDEDFTNTYLNLNYGVVSYRPNQSDDGELTRNTTNGEIHNLWVSQVNEGQITNYPYKLQERFQVASTHGQYYQLDYMSDADNDGQSDLVVWYCLDNRVGTGGDAQETIYSMSPNDVANNYYIYNKGNITYTGVGHSGDEYTTEEAKLFINTMIAAYNAGIKPPTITTFSDASLDAEEVDYAYRYFDDVSNLHFDDAGHDLKTKEVVYFTITDPNIVKGERRINLTCYGKSDGVVEDTDKVISYQGADVSVDKLDVTIYNAATNQPLTAGQNIVSGTRYYLLVDEADIDDQYTYSIYFEAFSTIPVDGEMQNTTNSYHRFDFTKVQLFDLE